MVLSGSSKLLLGPVAGWPMPFSLTTMLYIFIFNGDDVLPDLVVQHYSLESGSSYIE